MFIAVVLLQMLLVGNINLSIYVHPMIYLAFIVLLPMELAPVWVLLSGFALGGVMDVATGGAGLNSAATLVSAFARPLYLQLAVNKDDMRDGGMPTMRRLGYAGLLRYVAALVTVHCLIYFSLEAATWSYYYLTLLRVILSAAMTTLLILIFQLLYTDR